MNKEFLFFIIALLVALGACKRNLTPTSKANNPSEKSLSLQQIDFRYFAAKAKVGFKDNQNNINATVHLRVRKDSVIWLSLIPALGIEAIRCLITKDSVFFLDRLNNQYNQHDFKSLEKRINVKLSYPLLEALIIGNLPFNKNASDSLTMLPDKLYYLLFQKRDPNTIKNYINANSSKIERIQITDPANLRELSVVYSNFLPSSQFIFPNTSMVSLTYTNNKNIGSTLVSIQYTKVEFVETPLNFPFNIPAKFTRE